MCDDKKVTVPEILRFEGEEVEASKLVPHPMVLTPRPMPKEHERAWLSRTPSTLFH